MLYAQVRARADARPRSALLLVPMAVISVVLAPVVGRLTDRVHPRCIAGVRASLLLVVAGLAVRGA